MNHDGPCALHVRKKERAPIGGHDGIEILTGSCGQRRWGSIDEFSLDYSVCARFARETKLHEPLILDTNVIIDGRIADLCATGFFEPRFDCAAIYSLTNCKRLLIRATPLKRERGRRGLDILNELQRSREVDLTIHDTGDDADLPVDQQARPRRAAASCAAAYK